MCTTFPSRLCAGDNTRAVGVVAAVPVWVADDSVPVGQPLGPCEHLQLWSLGRSQHTANFDGFTSSFA
jgi:hypothetical protein